MPLTSVPDWFFFTILIALIISMILLFVRFLIGETPLDRLVVFESLTLALLCFIGLWSLALGAAWFFDVILVLSLMGFLSTVALAKFIERGDIGHE